MLKAFERIQQFGVFDDYSRPSDVEDFAELNLIYGWNYSGKTTLSRILRSLELQEVHPDYTGAQFVVSTEQDTQISENSLASNTEKIRVFNSDFVKENLSWEGDSFEPILLLGQESIDAQQEIQRNERLLERLREGYRSKQQSINDLDSRLRDKKTTQAKAIKQTLQLVEPFTATHLNNELSKVEADPRNFILKQEDLPSLHQDATTSEKDKLPRLSKISLPVASTGRLDGLGELLARQPPMSNTIQYLADHPDVANWIRTGLPLHEGLQNCEFCGNQLSSSRLTQLRSHFSKDVEDLEAALQKKKTEIENFQLSYTEFHPNDFYSSLRPELIATQSKLKERTRNYNQSISDLIAAIDKKLLAPFETIECPPFDPELGQAIAALEDTINSLISKNNERTDTFNQKKKRTIDILKRHFVAEFCLKEKLESYKAVTEILAKHKSWYERTALELRNRNKDLEAQISQAQKGREELNAFIEKFLSGSNVFVDVVKVGDAERFRLLRKGFPAKNLSEGERTAIAFAFFLIKLKESQDLSELIVYIDDPVSSLDSNHIFQIFATTKTFFFWQDQSDGDKWKLTIKQLFISTHNFEFLGLAKELPIKKNRRNYYFVKRVGIDTSAFITMPTSIIQYSSEYQYLWSVIYEFHVSTDKSNLEVLLGLPNALRRFVELYTYSKCPTNESVDRRADIVFGPEKSKRILKLLHYFSHSNNLLGISQNNDLICDIENVVDELIGLIRLDQQHYSALMRGLS